MRFPELSDFDVESQAGHGGGIYLLYAGDLLVYVGQTQNLIRRLADHRREGTKIFDTARVYHCDDLVSRLRIEGVLILQYLPRYNHALLLGIDGLTEKVWERDHKNIWASKRRKAPGRPRNRRELPEGI